MSAASIPAMTAYVWAYTVRPESREAFAAAYGPNGEWAEFFQRCSPGYVRTDLLFDEADENRFVTIDYFVDGSARRRLVETHAGEYNAIDKRWQDATIEEVFVGAFRVDAKE